MTDVIAAVTGASGGLGNAICASLAGAGASLIVLDLDDDRAHAAAGRLEAAGCRISHAAAVDVSSWNSVAETFAGIESKIGTLDILVNNAGIREIKNIESLPAAEWDSVIAVNLNGPFYCAKAALPLLKKKGGSIINIASVAGMIGIRSRAAYCSSKHGVIGLTKTLSYDLAAYGIRVNAVAPGAIPTPMTERYYSDGVFLHDLNHAVAQGNAGTPEAIGAAVAFLCSPAATFITGAVLPVDGGFIAEKSFATNASKTFVAQS